MLKKIQIHDYKSIGDIIFDFSSKKNNIVCLLGKNGAGKSNILKSIYYFFDYLDKNYSDIPIHDTVNPYKQKTTISITFDLSSLRSKALKNDRLKEHFDKLNYYIKENLLKDGNLAGFTNLISDSYDIIELRMTQFKDGKINWNVEDIRIRKIIKSLFPIYFIDTRNLDIFTWDKIWQVISDLVSSTPKIEENNIEQLLNNTFGKIYGRKYTESAEIISTILKTNHITFDKYHFDTRFKSALSMRFGGTDFLYNDKKLDFYSDGTNSHQYLTLFISIVSEISKKSCKFPIVLIDEPEIGLHSSFITEFVECLHQRITNNALLLMNTHSPQLIAELVYCKSNFSLYHVYTNRLHSHISKMNTKMLTERTRRVTLKETNCYFYDYIVYVEGETEIQLFHNKNIRNMFSKISKIFFYSFDGNEKDLKAASIEQLNLGTQYKLLVDIDKIIKYQQENDSSKHNYKKFKLNPDYLINPLYKETKMQQNKFNFFNVSSLDLVALKKSIDKLLKKEYSYNADKNYFASNNFNDLMQNIRLYCIKYNVIVNWSTIEGDLITYENIDKFLRFVDLKEINNCEQHSEICKLDDIKEKTVLVLLEMNGRTEKQEKPNKTPLPNSLSKIKKLQSGIMGGKTSGWVDDWLNYYFENYINTLEDEKQKRNQFKTDFPFLYDTLQILENMVE